MAEPSQSHETQSSGTKRYHLFSGDDQLSERVRAAMSAAGLAFTTTRVSESLDLVLPTLVEHADGRETAYAGYGRIMRDVLSNLQR